MSPPILDSLGNWSWHTPDANVYLVPHWPSFNTFLNLYQVSARLAPPVELLLYRRLEHFRVEIEWRYQSVTQLTLIKFYSDSQPWLGGVYYRPRGAVAAGPTANPLGPPTNVAVGGIDVVAGVEDAGETGATVVVVIVTAVATPCSAALATEAAVRVAASEAEAALLLAAAMTAFLIASAAAASVAADAAADAASAGCFFAWAASLAARSASTSASAAVRAAAAAFAAFVAAAHVALKATL